MGVGARTECALLTSQPLLWAYSVRPYTHPSGLAPKERQSPALGQSSLCLGSEKSSLCLCASVVKFFSCAFVEQA